MTEQEKVACPECLGIGVVVVQISRTGMTMGPNGEPMPRQEWTEDFDRCPECGGTGKAEVVP